MLSLTDVASRAGIGLRTLDRRMRAGVGPKATRVGRALVVTETDCAAFIAAEEARRGAA
jgi:hypothetical protein